MDPEATKRFGQKLLGMYTGAVLTKLDSRSSGYGYGYSYHYSYGKS